MLPDRPVMFHPKRPSAAWRPFTILEDGALLADVKLHGTQWALITQNPVFQHASRRDDELLMRWERDFFRKTLLKLDSLGRHLYIVYHAVWKEWSREDTQTLIEAYYKCGDDWSLILREPSYKFHVHRTVSESKEKWTELCDTFSKYCRDTKKWRTTRYILGSRYTAQNGQ
ncbi:hypothetical protein CPB85DRAFT_1029992 [Mucidula mucida]|nr:hypothetical protein CPB85DRAFT_1029992 [Mucidula mucida]